MLLQIIHIQFINPNKTVIHPA